MYMLITLSRGVLRVEIQLHTIPRSFVIHTAGLAYTCFFGRTSVFSESYLRSFQKSAEIKCRIVSTQHFINEALGGTT